MSKFKAFFTRFLAFFAIFFACVTGGMTPSFAADPVLDSTYKFAVRENGGKGFSFFINANMGSLYIDCGEHNDMGIQIEDVSTNVVYSVSSRYISVPDCSSSNYCGNGFFRYTCMSTYSGDDYVRIGGLANSYIQDETVIGFKNSESNVLQIYGSLGDIFPTKENNSVKQPTFNGSFKNCNNLSGNIPANLFTSDNSGSYTGIYGEPVKNMFRETFSSVGNATLPQGLFRGLSGTAASSVFEGTFYQARVSGTLDDKFFGSLRTPAAAMFKQTFYCQRCSIVLPTTGDLFGTLDGPAQQEMFFQTFLAKSAISGTLSDGFFGEISYSDNMTNAFYQTFYNCDNLSGQISRNLFHKLSTTSSGNESTVLVQMKDMFDGTGLDTNCASGYSLYPSARNVDGLYYDAKANATWSGKVTCTPNVAISFNGNGGTLSGTSTLYTTYGSENVYSINTVDFSSANATNSIATVPTATRTGYTFNGWATAASGGSLVYNSNAVLQSGVSNYTDSNGYWIVNGPITLYAQWTPNTYTVTLNKNHTDASGYTTGTNSVTATYGANMPSATMPTRTGYTFAGYYDTSATSGGNQYYTASGASARTWNKTSNTTLYARWEEDVYKIPLDDGTNGGQGGSGVVYEKYGIGWSLTNFGDMIDRVTVPTKPNSVFTGYWTNSSGGEVKIPSTGLLPNNRTFTQDTQLYAQFVACTCTNGANVSSCTVTGVTNNTCQYSYTCNNGYHVGSSGTTATGTFLGTAGVASNSSPACNGNTITLSWVNGGHGTAPTTPPSCTYGSTFTMPAAMTATGYTFGKWNVNGHTFNGGQTSVACNYENLGVYSGSATITASWTANNYEITLSAPDATVAGTTKIYTTHDTNVYLNSTRTQVMSTSNNPITIPTRNGYVFKGYYSASSNGTQYIGANGKITADGVTAGKGYTANATWYAQWTACACTNGTGATGCSATVSNNQCNYTWSCLNGYYSSTRSANNAGTSYTATCTACPTNYPNSEGSSATARTQCYSNTKSRAWTGSQTECALPTNCYSKTCNTCSNPACDYVAYSNSAGTGDGTIKSGCSTNNSACQQTVASVTALAGAYVASDGRSCSVCSSGYQATSGSTATSCTECTTEYATSGTALINHDAANDCKTTITLNKNGGSGTVQSVQGIADASITCSQGVSCDFGGTSALSQTGYNFIGGWGTENTCNSSTTIFTNPTGTYYACKSCADHYHLDNGVCVSDTYSITINACDGVSTVVADVWTGSGTSSMTKTNIPVGSSYDLASLVSVTPSAGFTSPYTYTLVSGEGTFNGSVFTVGYGDATICVSASNCATGYHLENGVCVLDTYTITYKHSNNVLGTQSCTYGTSVNLTQLDNLSDLTYVPSSTYGWAFVGWNSTVNNTTAEFQNGQLIQCTSDITLYGIWQRNISFKYYNGADSEVLTTDSVGPQFIRNNTEQSADLTSVSVPRLVAHASYGWNPYCWTHNPTSFQSSLNANATTATPITMAQPIYYAVYSRTPVVIYNGNNATSGSVSDTTFSVQYYHTARENTTSDSRKRLAYNGFTKDGYLFSGWTEDSTSGTLHQENENYSFPRSWNSLPTVTMYAKWTQNIVATASNVSLTYNGDEQSCAGGVVVTTPSSGYTIMYRSEANGPSSSDAPALRDVGGMAIYYTVSADGYNDAYGYYLCDMNPATMNPVPSDNTKVYDGASLSCDGNTWTNVPEGSVINYSTDGGNNYEPTVPTITNVSESGPINWIVTNPNYNDATGTFSCSVTSSNSTITIMDGSTDVTNGESRTTMPNNKVLTVTCSNGATPQITDSGNQTIATATISGNTITMVPHSAVGTTWEVSVGGMGSTTMTGEPGPSTITVTCPATQNHGAASATYKLKVYRGSCEVTFNPNSSSGSVVYPTDLTFGANTTSGGTLSVASSNTNVASASIDNGQVTLTPLQNGSSTITVTSAQTSNYNSCSKTYTLTVNRGTCSLTLDPTNDSVTYPATTSAFSITKDACCGALSASSDHSNIATVSLNGDNATVSYHAVGDATITVNAAQTNQCNAASATYTARANDRTIEVNKNGGSGTCAGESETTSGSLTCGFSGNCVAPSWNSQDCDIAKTDKIFTGWNTTANATGTNYGGGDTLGTSVTVIYAKWADINCQVVNGSDATLANPSVDGNAPRCVITCNEGYQESNTYTGTPGNPNYTYICQAQNCDEQLHARKNSEGAIYNYLMHPRTSSTPTTDRTLNVKFRNGDAEKTCYMKLTNGQGVTGSLNIKIGNDIYHAEPTSVTDPTNL